MFGRGLKLFRLSGFEVRLHSSWLILAVLIIWTLAAGFFPMQFPGYSRAVYIGMAAAAAVGLFFSIVVHEFAHSVVARRYGIPMNGITLFIFGGIAEMGEEPGSAKAEFLMAIAGPLMSVAVACGCFAVYSGAHMGGVYAPWTHVLFYLAWINAVLAVFNMIPAFPLDGGRVLRAAIWAKKGDILPATRIAAWIGSAFGYLLILLGIWSAFRGSFINGLWWIFIGMFVRNASEMSYRQVKMRRLQEQSRLRNMFGEEEMHGPVIDATAEHHEPEKTHVP